MNKDEFVESLIAAVRNTSIQSVVGLLEKPPGRRPKEALVSTSTWYNGLAVEDKMFVKTIITDAVDATFYGLLCVFDGVRVIEDQPEKNNIQLKYTGDPQSLLNEHDGEYLHDIYKDKTESLV